MAIPVILLVIAWLSLPVIVVHGSFWMLYTAATQAPTDTTAWLSYLLSADGLLQAGCLLASAITVWMGARCLFIFESLTRRAGRNGLWAVSGTLLGVFYSVLLAHIVAFCAAGSPVALAFIHDPGAETAWGLVGALQGLVVGLTLSHGIHLEHRRTATLEPPAPTLIHGSLDNVMVPIRPQRD